MSATAEQVKNEAPHEPNSTKNDILISKCTIHTLIKVYEANLENTNKQLKTLESVLAGFPNNTKQWIDIYGDEMQAVLAQIKKNAGEFLKIMQTNKTTLIYAIALCQTISLQHDCYEVYSENAVVINGLALLNLNPMTQLTSALDICAKTINHLKAEIDARQNETNNLIKRQRDIVAKFKAEKPQGGLSGLTGLSLKPNPANTNTAAAGTATASAANTQTAAAGTKPTA